jgi:hypothetical protein
MIFIHGTWSVFMRKLKNNEINNLYKFLNQHTIDNLNILGQLDNEPDSEIWVNDGNIIEGVLIKSPHSNTFQFNTYNDNVIIEAVNDILCKYDYVLMSAIREGLCEKLFPLVIIKTNQSVIIVLFTITMIKP